MPSSVNDFVDQNKDRLLSELKDLLRIPSVSTLPEHAGDVRKAAEFCADALRAVGMENVEIISTDLHPLVYADWLHAPGKPTVLCYGHFDVQPPDPLDLWTSPPFEPAERDGNLYARGSADDKGQMYMHIKAVEALRAANGTLPLNLKFILEGEEEIGGGSVAKYVEEIAKSNPGKLKADIALVSDTALFADGIPTICNGLRGLMYTEIEAHGPGKDLHSGLYGGVAPNAVFGLIELLSKMKEPNGRILIPAVYQDVEAPSEAEKKGWASLPYDEQDYMTREVGSTALTGEKGYSTWEKTWARPTLEVHGIAGGFTGAGAKTVIPAVATAKVSMRLVPNMSPEKTLAAFKKFVKENTPKGITMETRLLSYTPGVVVNPDHPAIKVAAKAIGEVFGKETVFVRSGGAIPIVTDFKKHLGLSTILMGFGLPDDCLHSPNEKYKIANYYAGIKTIAHFFEEYGKQSA